MDRIYVIKHKWHHEGLSIRQIAPPVPQKITSYTGQTVAAFEQPSA